MKPYGDNSFQFEENYGNAMKKYGFAKYNPDRKYSLCLKRGQGHRGSIKDQLRNI